ncbi:MAG TPA: hypothetical protein DEQ02_07805 [Ruminococcaceae bacterium]|nr:hypothetical protein [Oscillospiraceae bacterium]
MLGKLLKHEFRQTARILPFVFLSAVVLSAFAFISYQTKFESFQAIATLLMVVSIAGIPIVSFIFLIQRFGKNLFGGEGYLMFTLPVKSVELYWSKFISTMVWGAASIVVSFGELMLFIYFVGGMTGAGVTELIMIFEQIFAVGNIHIILIYLLCALAVFLFSFTAVVFFSITLSNTGIGGKSPNLIAFVFFMVISIVLNTLESLSMVLIPVSLRITTSPPSIAIVNENMMSMLNNINGAGLDTILIGIGNFLVTIPVAIAAIAITIRMMKKKVNLR